MDVQMGVFVVVQAGAPQLCVVERKSQRPHQMQRGAGIGTEPDDVAGVRRNLGLIERDLDHRSTL